MEVNPIYQRRISCIEFIKSLNWGGGSHISFTWTAGDVLVLPMAAVTHTVTDEVRTDADVGVTLKRISTAERL